MEPNPISFGWICKGNNLWTVTFGEEAMKKALPVYKLFLYELDPPNDPIATVRVKDGQLHILGRDACMLILCFAT